MKKPIRILLICYFIIVISLSACANGSEKKEMLIETIAIKVQAMATINLGEFQLEQIKNSIRDKNYTIEELKQLNASMEARQSSQEIYQKSYLWMSATLERELRAKKIELAKLGY